MQHMLVPDQSGKGRWMLILDCPWDQQYKLYDRNSGTTGPSFALCASCQYQQGINFQLSPPDADWFVQPIPERLVCGFPFGTNTVLGVEQAPGWQATICADRIHLRQN